MPAIHARDPAGPRRPPRVLPRRRKSPKGCAIVPRIARPMPVTCPSQPASLATTTGSSRPASTATGDVENLARRVIRPPDNADAGARRHVVRIPCDHRIVARAQVGGRGDKDLARRIAAGDNEFVVDDPADASRQRQVPRAPLLDGRRRKPARRHRERQVGEHDDNQRRGERQQRSRRSRPDIAGGQCALRLVSMCQRVRQRMRRSNRSDQLSM